MPKILIIEDDIDMAEAVRMPLEAKVEPFPKRTASSPSRCCEFV